MTEANVAARFYHSPRCLFCGKNNRRRQSRKGNFWKCRHCQQMNPGPTMVTAMVQHFTSAPAGNRAHANGNGHTQPAAQPVKAAATTIKGAEPTPTKKLATPAKPAPVKAAVTAPAATPKTPPPPAKKSGLFERVLYGE